MIVLTVANKAICHLTIKEADVNFQLPWLKKEKATEELAGTFMLVGLGNPGREYRETRHNIGFMLMDRFAERHEFKGMKVQNKAIVTLGRINDHRIILVKPQTYMNLSGQAVAALARFYKVDFSNLIVAHDDVDLPFGTIRIRPGGGSAGQKGVGSIIQQLGTQEFPRLRMGIGRPPGQMDAAAFVLLPFPKAEQEFLRGFIDRAVDALDCFIENGLDTAMNRYNPTTQE